MPRLPRFTRNTDMACPDSIGPVSRVSLIMLLYIPVRTRACPCTKRNGNSSVTQRRSEQRQNLGTGISCVTFEHYCGSEAARFLTHFIPNLIQDWPGSTGKLRRAKTTGRVSAWNQIWDPKCSKIAPKTGLRNLIF